MNNMMYWLFMILAVVVSSFSQILLKKSANKEHENLIKEYLNPYVIIGYGMMVVSTILMILAYHKIEYKNGPVIESLGYLLIMFLSFLFFKEPITKKKICGNLLILLGIFIFYV
ncbi:MAG: EamA family transporter [Lachnospiraceae bacterium]|nr:EamA family transporter [Lachnospiraceae bacterium]